MAKFFQRRVRVLLGAAIVGFSLWKAAPQVPALQATDRVLFQVVTGASANPPFFVSGEGSHAQPWMVRTRASSKFDGRVRPPTIVSIASPSAEYFQSFPPSPVDYALVFKYLKARGVRHVAVGSVMQWDAGTPDSNQKNTLDDWLAAPKAQVPPAPSPGQGESSPDSEHDAPKPVSVRGPTGFPSFVTGTPLTRKGESSPIPAAFVRASLPVAAVVGDTGRLPVVNQLAVKGVMLGDAHTLSGFSLVDSEAGSSSMPLVARWDDRIVFAFPVVTAFAERSWPVEGIELRLGEYLKLAPGGPVIPIDDTGHLIGKLPKISAIPVPLEALLDEDTKIPEDSVTILMDDRQVSDPTDRPITSPGTSLLAMMRADAFLTPLRTFPRTSQPVEGCLILGLAFLLGMCASSDLFRLRLGFGIIFATVLILQVMDASLAGIWLPGVPFLAMVVVGYAVAWPFKQASAAAPFSAAEDAEIEQWQDRNLQLARSFDPGTEPPHNTEPDLQIVPHPQPGPESVVASVVTVPEPHQNPPDPDSEIAVRAGNDEPDEPPIKAAPAKKAARKTAKKAATKKAPDAQSPLVARKVAKKAAKKTATGATPAPPGDEALPVAPKATPRKAAKKAAKLSPPAAAAPPAGIPAKKAARKAAKKTVKGEPDSDPPPPAE